LKSLKEMQHDDDAKGALTDRLNDAAREIICE
jgi:hypothetical protein